jgi:hypothetical protein
LAGGQAVNLIFADVHDRYGYKLLRIRDMNTYDPSLQKKRLMTLAHLLLLHRYKAGLVHYLGPTNDNQQRFSVRRFGYRDRRLASEDLLFPINRCPERSESVQRANVVEGRVVTHPPPQLFSGLHCGLS